MEVIVDTNVPVVANGSSEQASPGCVLACIQRLRQVIQAGKIVLDDQWLILGEYIRNLRSSGQPGVGDAFLKWVLVNRANPERCILVTITPLNPDDANETGLAEFPHDPALEKFDPNDRKFVAVACAHPNHPPILQAADHKWWAFKDILASHKVTVEFLCEEDLHRWIVEQG